MGDQEIQEARVQLQESRELGEAHKEREAELLCSLGVATYLTE